MKGVFLLMPVLDLADTDSMSENLCLLSIFLTLPFFERATERITKSLLCSWGSSQIRNVCYAHQGQRAAVYIHIGRDVYLPN